MRKIFNKKIIANEDLIYQQEYDSWIESNPVAEMQKRCSNELNSKEELLIERYREGLTLDIGCMTGQKTFPYFIKKRASLLGLEKFSKYIQAAPEEWRNKLIWGDISDPALVLKTKPKAQVDLALMLGWVICGMHLKKGRISAIKNINKLLKIDGILLMDTLFFGEQFINMETGYRSKLFGSNPHQYFMSEPEIYALLEGNGFKELECHMHQEKGSQTTSFIYAFQKTG